MSRREHQVRVGLDVYTRVKRQGRGGDRGEETILETENFDLVNVSPETTATETSLGTARRGITVFIHKRSAHLGSLGWECRG